MDISDHKLPLTLENVRAIAKATFPEAFDKLCCTAPAFEWLEFDVNDAQSIGADRAVYRSLKRSTHNRLLAVGYYSPGPAVDDGDDETPADRVAAHVHADPAEVRFYRIIQNEDGSRSLEDVNSTSAVDFDLPFCDVSNSQGDHKAGHRVTALIEWFFLDAGLVPELARPEGDPSKFTRNFRASCLWVGNGGNQPNELLTRRSSAHLEERDLTKEMIPVRPKRSSTVSYRLAASVSDDFRSPPIKRSATDTTQVKRQRDEESLARPTKHRRTQSEQVTPLAIMAHLPSASVPSSPRTPTLSDALSINRAQGDRIIHLNEQYRSLRTEFSRFADKQAGLVAQLKEAKDKVAQVEARAVELDSEVERLRVRLQRAEDELTKPPAEIAIADADPNGRNGEIVGRSGTDRRARRR